MLLYWRIEPWPRLWTSLIALDLSVVGLLLAQRRRLGLSLAAIVMAFDVAANTYAWLVMKIPLFGVPLPLQTAFFGFVIGSIAFLWPQRGRSA